MNAARGRCVGVVDWNDCGKTALMRAIAHRQGGGDRGLHKDAAVGRAGERHGTPGADAGG